jgi:hypothetical protein
MFSLLKVPQSNRGIFGSGRYKTIHGVHGHLGDVAPVARHRVLLWLPGQPVAHLVGAWAAAKGIGQSFAPFASGAVFHLLDSFFEVPNLPLQLHQRRPFLFKRILLARFLWNFQFDLCLFAEFFVQILEVIH